MGLGGKSYALDFWSRVSEINRVPAKVLPFPPRPWPRPPTSGWHEPPKRADLKAWGDHICSVALSGDSHKHRRHLFKVLLESAWEFTNWLTHSKSSHWHDAEAALSVSENAINLCISAVIRHVRGVPEHCPTCGSQRLSPERGYRTDFPGLEWERPTCDKCGWVGEPVPIEAGSGSHDEVRSEPPEGECVIPTSAHCASRYIVLKNDIRSCNVAPVCAIRVSRRGWWLAM